MSKIILTGANGMFGQDFSFIARKNGFEVIETDVHNMDITDIDCVRTFLKKNKCDYVVHAAAYTNVDGAETDEATAFLINGKGTENLAVATAELDIPIIYISTDYVFDGTKTSPYQIDDEPNPQTVYGATKLAGEVAVKNINPKHYIARTSWLYGHKGKNFVETMISLSEKMPELKVVNDQKGCPTWTYDLSKALMTLIKEQKPYGIYHACGAGETTWHGFACKIFELMGIKTPVKPCTTDDFPRPARRPANSVMDNGGLCENWQKSLSEYIRMRG